MAAHAAIELHAVSKRYFLGEDHGSEDSVREALASSMRRLLRRRDRSARREIWSLCDVSFKVAEGEALGIIGRNGAGKSTLLKVITRITEPTSGISRTRGRVGALLEVGTGFHPELTGRENLYLNGAILGMGRRQITRQFDEIVAFSGVERFLDTPVKRYSSGMYLRLAFAVAAHLEADIMVVDEVLAVGDAEFQRKCLGKMADVERSGRTVLFVSHNLDAIVRLCPTSIWLDCGTVVAHGPTAKVVDAYLASGVSRTDVATFIDHSDAPVSLQSVSLLGADGQPSSTLRRHQPFTVEVCFILREEVVGLDVAAYVQNLKGQRLVDEAWSDVAPDTLAPPGAYRARLTIPPVLNAGDYTVGVWIGSSHDTLAWENEVLAFRLEGSANGRSERVLQLSLAWHVHRSGLPE